MQKIFDEYLVGEVQLINVGSTKLIFQFQYYNIFVDTTYHIQMKEKFDLFVA